MTSPQKLIAKLLKTKPDSHWRVLEDVYGDAEHELLRAVIDSEEVTLGQLGSLWDGLSKHEWTAAETLRALGQIPKVSSRSHVCPHLPSWPRDLDEMVMEVACDAQAREVLRDSAASLPRPMKVGVAWCLARFGEPVAKLLGTQVKALAKQHELNESVLWPVDGKLVSRTLWTDDGEPDDALREMAELLGGWDSYLDALCQARLKDAAKLLAKTPAGTNRWRVGDLRLVIPRASVEQLSDLLACCWYGSGMFGSVARTLPRLRPELGPSDWATIIGALAQRSTSHPLLSDLAVVTVLASVDAGLEPSPEVFDHLGLPAPQDALYGLDNEIGHALNTGTPVVTGPVLPPPRFAPFMQAILAQGSERIAARVRADQSPSSWSSAPWFSALVDDEVLWSEVIEVIVDKPTGWPMEEAGYGLATLPAAALPLLRDAEQRATNDRQRTTLGFAIMAIATREGTVDGFESFIKPWTLRYNNIDRLMFERAQAAFPELAPASSSSETAVVERDVAEIFAEFGVDAGEACYGLRFSMDSTDDYNRMGGSAPGVDDTRWPRHDDEPMRHILTLDLRTMPELAQHHPEARTLSVFVDPLGLDGGEPPHEIVLSSEAQVSAVLTPDDAESHFEVYAVGVPADPPRELTQALGRMDGQVFGPVWWIQEEEFDEPFLQIGPDLCPISLGDGRLYCSWDAMTFQAS